MDAMQEKTFQMSDSFVIAALVALSGGAQDAYTFFGRGGVFANAQTGSVFTKPLFCRGSIEIIPGVQKIFRAG